MIPFIIGCILRYISIKTNKDHVLYLKEPTIICDSGIYKYIRHPSYLGALLIIYGIAQFFFGWYLAIPFLYFSYLFLCRIMLDEEQFLLHSNRGLEYMAYARKVKYRLIPYIF